MHLLLSLLVHDVHHHHLHDVWRQTVHEFLLSLDHFRHMLDLVEIIRIVHVVFFLDSKLVVDLVAH